MKFIYSIRNLIYIFFHSELNYLVDFVLSMRWNDPRLQFLNLKELYDLNALPMDIMNKVQLFS